MIPFRIFTFLSLLLLLAALALGGCYERMYDQEYVHTQEALPPPAPRGTVPISGGIESLKNADPRGLQNPLPADEKTLDLGKWAYENYCIHCHGPAADGRGTVGQSFAPLPTDLRSSQVQDQRDGELFAKISLGYRRHPPLATTMSEEERWASVVYIRSLKK